MVAPHRTTRHAWTLAVLALATLLASLCCAIGSAQAAALSFYGSFDDALTPWNLGGGGPQCANYGVVSNNQRLRGNFFVDTSVGGQGTASGRFDLPPSQMPNFPLQACELTHPVQLGLGTDDYYGYMFYVPTGWDTGTSAFWGITVAQFHFQNIWAAPLVFELHDDHLTLAIASGACSSYLTATPGCQFVSNADGTCSRNTGVTCLPPAEPVPAPMQQGVWHEVIMHVHWASDSSGVVEAWTRVEGQTAWTQTVELSGFPTVQWDVTQGCCLTAATDKVGAYRGYSTVPVSVWEDNISVASDFTSVADTMPMAPGGQPPPPPPPAGGGPPGGAPGSTSGSRPPSVTPTRPRAPRPKATASPQRRARTARAHSASSSVFDRACVAAGVRRAWLRRHRHAGAVRRKVLAMRRVTRHPRRGVTLTLYCS